MLLVLFAPVVSFCQAQWSHSGYATVADPPTGNKGPKIGVFDDGTALVFWGQTGGKLWVARETLAGGFLDPVEVDAGGTTPFISSIEGPELAVWGNDLAYIAFVTNSGQAWMARSSDGGMTWTSDRMSPSGASVILAQVGVDDSGHPIGAWLQDNGSSYSWEIARSTDFGATFPTAVTANISAAGFNVCECCPSTLLFSGDTATLLFRNNDSDIRDIWAAVSTDGGASFPTAVDIDPTDWLITGCPATGPDGFYGTDSIYTAWITGAFGGTELWVSALDRETQTAGAARMIPSSTARDPQLAGGQDALGNLYGVVWHVPGPGSREVFFASPSREVGSGNFASPIRISDETALASYADIAFKGDGSFSVVYEQAGTVQFVNVFLTAPTGLEVVQEDFARIWKHNDMLQWQSDYQLRGIRVLDLSGREIVGIDRPASSGSVPIQNLQYLIIELESETGIQRTLLP